MGLSCVCPDRISILVLYSAVAAPATPAYRITFVFYLILLKGFRWLVGFSASGFRLRFQNCSGSSHAISELKRRTASDLKPEINTYLGPPFFFRPPKVKVKTYCVLAHSGYRELVLVLTATSIPPPS